MQIDSFVNNKKHYLGSTLIAHRSLVVNVVDKNKLNRIKVNVLRRETVLEIEPHRAAMPVRDVQL